MKVLVNTGGIVQTNSFLVADEIAKKAVIFDAPDHTTGELIREAKDRGWEITGLWLTHGHFDHVADHAEVTGACPAAKVLIHAADEPMLRDPMGALPWSLPFTIPGRSADMTVAEGQELAVGGMKVQVMHTPGHSPGHVVYYFPDDHVLVGGDMIIGGAIGRVDLPGGDEREMVRSLRRIMQLPGNTRLLPGHGEIATLDEERRTNAYLGEML